MESEANAGMAFESFQERQIAATVGLLENVLEIPNRLVRVDQQDEPESGHRGPQSCDSE